MKQTKIWNKIKIILLFYFVNKYKIFRSFQMKLKWYEIENMVWRQQNVDFHKNSLHCFITFKTYQRIQTQESQNHCNTLKEYSPFPRQAPFMIQTLISPYIAKPMSLLQSCWAERSLSISLLPAKHHWNKVVQNFTVSSRKH
jgi:hypothetical protein